MDFNVNIERTYDISLISSVAFHPDIVKDLLEDNQIVDDCKFDTDKDCYLSVTIKSDLIGVYVLKPLSKTVLELHPMVIPKFRSKASKGIKCVFKWLLKNCDESVQKVTAQFPLKSKNIERFALHNGFRVEGVNRASFMRNNELLDQTMVGITRAEITEVIK